MLNIVDLEGKLNQIDGNGYKAYREIQNAYDCETCIIFIDHVQADPFAPPSKIRLRVSMKKADFPEYLYTGERLTALEDIVARFVRKEINKTTGKIHGTGKSGNISIDAGQQEIIKRSAVKITSDFIEARLAVGLPAAGRRIKGKEAIQILCRDLIRLAEKNLYFSELDEDILKEHVYLYEDQQLIRNQINSEGLAAFVGNGSILPRKSGNSDQPMAENEAVSFKSPPEMEVEVNTLHHGKIKGMGIPEGISLIVGGGYHGKSTLLRAIERGVYNHIKGDGREWAITTSDAVKIRAEDGRSIKKVDIRYFIDNLPFGKDTSEFSSENASGSTSQAANIVEAIEAGARLLLLDEDTSATNFMIRDARMQKLISREKEPITPFIDRIGPLYDQYGISTILVIGGAGDYIDVARKVILLDAYKVFDVTHEAFAISEEIQSNRQKEEDGVLETSKSRVIKKDSFNMLKRDKAKVGAKGLHTVMLAKQPIELQAVEQLIDSSQSRAIAECLRYMQKYVDGRRTLAEILELICEDMKHDFEVISPFKSGYHPGELALPRKYELAAAINRMRSLIVE